jgi:hypothetical protein
MEEKKTETKAIKKDQEKKVQDIYIHCQNKICQIWIIMYQKHEDVNITKYSDNHRE